MWQPQVTGMAGAWRGQVVVTTAGLHPSLVAALLGGRLPLSLLVSIACMDVGIRVHALHHRCANL